MRFTRSAVAVRSAFASPNRWPSGLVRTNARITRTPVICSRSTWLIRSILTCMTRNCGTTVISMAPMTTAITGTATTSRSDSTAPSLTAMIIPPTHMIGAMTISVSPICRNSWICWISLVLRVIRDGVPKRFISRAEKDCTRVNTAARMSAPAPIATRDAQYTATIARTPTARAMASMTPPVVKM